MQVEDSVVSYGGVKRLLGAAEICVAVKVMAAMVKVGE
jgi:hypothetical protein